MNKATPQSDPVFILIVIPMMNEESNVAIVHECIKAVFGQLPKYTYEMIYVDDSSADDSVQEVRRLEALDPNVRVITLARDL